MQLVLFAFAISMMLADHFVAYAANQNDTGSFNSSKVISENQSINNALFEKLDNDLECLDAIDPLGVFTAGQKRGLLTENHKVYSMARELLNSINKKYFEKIPGYLNPAEPFLLYKLGDHPNYVLLVAVPKIKSAGGVLPMFASPGILKFRTNGHAIFLGESFDYQQDIKDTYVPFVLNIHGNNRLLDQTLYILNTLPDIVPLSRVMSEAEYEKWTQGKIDEIISDYPESPVYFGYNNYDFPSEVGREQRRIYYVTIPRNILLNLLKSGNLVINSYTSHLHDYQYGAKHDARSPFGLEIEILPLGKVGKMAIASYMLKLRRGALMPYYDQREIHISNEIQSQSSENQKRRLSLNCRPAPLAVK